MNTILGASGQVGSAIVANLLKANAPVKGVFRTSDKADVLRQKGVPVAIADSFDLPALQTALKDGSAVFVLTPETESSKDVIGDTRKILANYRSAVESSPIKKIIGLSSMGAQCATDAGNLEMSYMLEHAFTGLDIQQIFVRPAYYYSNWLLSLPIVKEQGFLPTFYPVDLQIPMTSPGDIAEFVAERLMQPIEGSPIYEVEGPAWYSSRDVAAAFSAALGQKVEVRQTPESTWGEQLRKTGFTPNAAENFIQMTHRVISGDAGPEAHGTISIKTQTTLQQYITAKLHI